MCSTCSVESKWKGPKLREWNQEAKIFRIKNNLTYACSFLSIADCVYAGYTCTTFYYHALGALRGRRKLLFHDGMSEKDCEAIIWALRTEGRNGLGQGLEEIQVNGFYKCPLSDPLLEKLVYSVEEACPDLQNFQIQGSLQTLTVGQTCIIMSGRRSIKNPPAL
eukprot:TRINITY_DN359_c1_g1_i1.p1 TRINITY_DN359_c1_g1~~TRINITY_DN359_c1_g1_i1.p1  ORF type:complete len:164 (-),score=21.47 TRINITY_DN359_c1_g1_i1:325-816(-)